MDSDPLYNAQDMDIKKLAVGAPAITGGTARVVVSFENFGKETVTYLLIKRPVGWRISDVQYDRGPSLLAIYKKAR